MFYISESRYLSGEVLTLWDQKQFYRALVVRRYLYSKYKYCFLDILDFILGP